MAKAGIIILKDKWDQKKQKGLIRVNHKFIDQLKASLTLIKTINNEGVIVKSLGVSGILKKADKKYLAS